MKTPDLDRIQSEKEVSVSDFLNSYNKILPTEFPRASLLLLQEFRKTHATLFKGKNSWSFDQHRKKVMDWLPSQIV